MANKIEFNILITGMDNFSDTLKKGSESLESFKRTSISVGKELSKVGNLAAITGAAISGPLILAFNNAAKSSLSAANEMNRLSQIASDFQKEVAAAIVPVVSRFVTVVSQLFDAFNKLDPVLRAQIIQVTLISGVFLLLSGIFTSLIAKIFIFVGNLAGLLGKLLAFAAVNPLFLSIAVSIGFLISLMFKFKAVADNTLNIFETLFLALKNGFLVVSTGITEALSKIYAGLAKVYEFLAKLPGPQQAFFKSTADGARNLSAILHDLSNNAAKGVIDTSQKMGEILVTGTSDWARGFENVKNSVTNFLNALKQIGSGGSGGQSLAQGFFSGFSDGLGQIGVKLADLHQQGVDFANTLQNGLATAFSSIITGAQSAGEAFAAFGETILKAIVDFIAQWIAFQIISRVFTAAATALGITTAATLAAAYAPAAAFASLASFGANAAPAAAGIASTVGLANLLAIPKFAYGTGNMKDDTLGLFNKGEVVIPNTFSDAIRRGDLSLSGGKGSGSQGSGIVFDFTGAQFNGVTDKLVKDIFTKASENIASKTLAFRGVR